MILADTSSLSGLRCSKILAQTSSGIRSTASDGPSNLVLLQAQVNTHETQAPLQQHMMKLALNTNLVRMFQNKRNLGRYSTKVVAG